MILVSAVVVIAIIAIGFLWYMSIYRPPYLPSLQIPGMQSIDMVSYDNRGAHFDVTVKHLDMEYVCNLYIALSAEDKWVLTDEDEVFTVVISDERNLDLTANNKMIGRVPIVFISPISNSRTYRIGAPNQSKKPVSVAEGSVNLVSPDSNTLIRGAEGLRVKLFENRDEIASGMLPLAVSIENRCVLSIDGLQTRALSGKGLIQGYWGIRDIYEGTYSVYPSGRFTGVDLVKLEGCTIAKRDDLMALVSKTFDAIDLWNGESTHRIDLGDITVRPGGFAHIASDGSLAFSSTDRQLFMADSDGKIEKLQWEAEPSEIVTSGDILISDDGSVLNLISEEQGKLERNYDFYHAGLGMSIEDNTLTGWRLTVNGEEKVWSIEASNMNNAEMNIVSSDIVYFTNDGRCTQFINVGSGFTSEVPEIFEESTPLVWVDAHELSFPGGEGVENDVVAFDGDDNLVWRRPGGHYLSRVGHRAVMVVGDDEIYVYDLRTGIEACSWEHDPTSSVHPTDGVEVISVDEDSTIVQIVAQTIDGEFEPWVLIVSRRISNK